MQLGTRDRFLYVECGACESLQIAEIPADLGRYYPSDYFSFSLKEPRPPGAYHWLRGIRDRAALTGRNPIGRFLSAMTQYPFAEVGAWLTELRVPLDARILDVGCGAGQLLCDLADVGYRGLHGVDPFIARDVVYPNGVRIQKCTINEMSGTFDLVLFVHSLEHVPDPAQALVSVARLLDPGGRCIVWCPTVPCWAWEHYGDAWVQLDAPRHLIIPSPRAMRSMGDQASLELAKVRYNSTEFQFTGSESYRRDIALTEAGSRFSRIELRAFRRRARRLNADGRGDQAAFFFRK
jgi:SAM-dependent methyltransferase